MKIDRRSFFGLLFAPFLERFRKVFGKKEELVSYRFKYVAAVLDGPKDPLAMYRYSEKFVFKNDKILKEAAEALGKAAAERMDRNILEVLKNG